MNWLQRHWDARAACNFAFGGTGSGLLVVVALSFTNNDYLVLASLALMAAGLGAVWLEIGRKLRAVHVFFNPFTSWMTRESFAAVVVFVLGIAYLFFAERMLLYGAALAAAVFLWCQARMLHGAKGIPAWRAPQVVPLVVATGLAEGAGLAVSLSAGNATLAIFILAVLARAMAWWRYRAAVKAPALERPGSALVWAGTAGALALLFVSPPLAAAAAVGTGWWLKLALVTRASFNQGYSLPHLPVRGAR